MTPKSILDQSYFDKQDFPFIFPGVYIDKFKYKITLLSEVLCSQWYFPANFFVMEIEMRKIRENWEVGEQLTKLVCKDIQLLP